MAARLPCAGGLPRLRRHSGDPPGRLIPELHLKRNRSLTQPYFDRTEGGARLSISPGNYSSSNYTLELVIYSTSGPYRDQKYAYFERDFYVAYNGKGYGYSYGEVRIVEHSSLLANFSCYNSLNFTI